MVTFFQKRIESMTSTQLEEQYRELVANGAAGSAEALACQTEFEVRKIARRGAAFERFALSEQELDAVVEMKLALRDKMQRVLDGELEGICLCADGMVPQKGVYGSGAAFYRSETPFGVKFVYKASPEASGIYVDGEYSGTGKLIGEGQVPYADIALKDFEKKIDVVFRARVISKTQNDNHRPCLMSFEEILEERAIAVPKM